MTHASLCKRTYKNSLRFLRYSASVRPSNSTHKMSILHSLGGWCLLTVLFLATGNPLTASAPPAVPVVVTTTTLPGGTVGQPYLNASGNTVHLNASGGSGTYGWCYATVSTAPPCTVEAPFTASGLTFGTDGTITGTPNQATTITFYASAHNAAKISHASPFVQLTITITACTATTITPASPLPQGEVSVPYSPIQFTATGCAAPYTFTATVSTSGANSFPSGLTLSTSTGFFTGTPTLAGTFNIVITAIDAYQEQTPAQYTITIVPPPTISTPSPLPNGIVNVAYSQQIAATGGTPPYIFSMNAQPPGIVNVGQSTGILFGTPTTTGTYSFNIGVTDSLGVQTVTPFQVTFVAVSSQVQVMPLSLTFNASVNGNPPPPQAITLVPSATATPPVKFTTVVDAGQSNTTAPSWITVNQAAGGTPTGLVVSVNQGTMAAGTYSARIQVLDPVGVPTDIPVTLNVTSPPQQLTVAPAVLNFAALSSASGNLTQNVLVSNTGAAPLAFNTSVTGNSSLIASVASNSSQTTPNGPSVLQVQVNTDGLQVGAYNNTIQLSSAAGNVQVPVSLFVAGSGPILAVNTTGVLFQAVAGGGSTATQNIEVMNAGDPSSTVNWSASLVTGSNWLSLTNSSGTATSSTPGVLTLALAANATQLAPGPYYAIVEITDSNSLNSPQYVTAVMDLELSAAPPSLNLAPGGLFFTAPAGGSAPPFQPIQINSSSASPVTFNAATYTVGNGTWLSVAPASGTASGQTAGSIGVTVDPTSLSAGVYTGQVSVSIGDVLQSVNVTFVVENSGSSSSTSSSSLKPRQSGCTASKVVITETGLANNFGVPAGWPEPLIVQLTDDCGNPITNGNVVATFSNGDAGLTLVGDSLGNYSATWQPGSANGINMVVNFNATSGALQSGAAQLFGTVTPNLTPPPTLAPDGTLNNLNPVVGAALSPGTIAQVYGSGLSSKTVSTGVLPLATTLNNTYALVGSVQAPLYFLSNGQINLQIPFELKANQQIPILLSVNNALTLPQMLNIVPATPGVLSANDGPNAASVQNGAHIAAQHADGSMVSSSNPAQPGEYLVMYLVGLGATSPSVASGAPAPSSPLAEVAMEPTVTVGSQPSNVVFAGLTPGFVGLYQVNFQVPPSSASGELQVDVTQNGVAANPTLLPVSN